MIPALGRAASENGITSANQAFADGKRVAVEERAQRAEAAHDHRAAVKVSLP